MIPHNHTERIEGCFRCDLSADEVDRFDYAVIDASDKDGVDYSKECYDLDYEVDNV